MAALAGAGFDQEARSGSATGTGPGRDESSAQPLERAHLARLAGRLQPPAGSGACCNASTSGRVRWGATAAAAVLTTPPRSPPRTPPARGGPLAARGGAAVPG